MKKLTFWKSLFLLCALIVGSTSVWADDIDVTISFGNTTGYWAAHDDASYTDSDSRSWSRTFVAKGNTCSGQPLYSQFGNSSNACTSLVLTATAGSNMTVTAFSVKMAGGSGGSNPTTGTIYLYKKSGETETQLATASVSGTDDVVCSISSSQEFSSTDILKVEYVGTKKAIRIKELSYSYTTGGSSATEDCDLALTGDPVSLSFDLYNDKTKEISYTTSSTGAVSVESNDYVDAVVDATNKKITLTAKKVTATPQDITVNQASDDTYKAGSATFTVSIANSEPAQPYHLVTDASQLANGNKIIIVYGDDYALSTTQATNNRPATAIEKEVDGSILLYPGTSVQVLTLEETDDDNVWYLQTTGDNYLYAASGSSNHLKTAKKTTVNDDGKALFTFFEGNANIVFQGDNSHNVLRFNPNNNSPIFSCYASSSTTGDPDVQVYINSVKLTPAKTYTTLTSAYALDFTNVSGLEAFIAKDGVSEGSVKMTQVNKVPAGTGLVLKAATPNSAVNIPVFDGTGADDVSGNLMVGSATETTAIEKDGGYILSNGVFQPADAGTLAAGKAYLQIAVTSARSLEMSFDDATTAINGIEEVAPVNVKTRKVVKNGRLVIETANGEFTIDGARMK